MSQYGYLVFHLREALKIVKEFKNNDVADDLARLINLIKEEIND